MQPNEKELNAILFDQLSLVERIERALKAAVSRLRKLKLILCGRKLNGNCIRARR